jgi:MYXO-CTERM domain-containing protein
VKPEGVSTATVIDLAGTCTPYFNGSNFYPNDCDTWYEDHPKGTDAVTMNIFYTLGNGSELTFGLLGTKAGGTADFNSAEPKVTVRLDQDQALASIDKVPIQGMDSNDDGKDDHGIIDEGHEATFSLEDATVLSEPVTPPVVKPEEKEDAGGCACSTPGQVTDKTRNDLGTLLPLAALGLLAYRRRKGFVNIES